MTPGPARSCLPARWSRQTFDGIAETPQFAADRRNDLLRGIDTQRQGPGMSVDRVTMMTQNVGGLLVDLREVVVDHAQFFAPSASRPTGH